MNFSKLSALTTIFLICFFAFLLLMQTCFALRIYVYVLKKKPPNKLGQYTLPLLCFDRVVVSL